MEAFYKERQGLIANLLVDNQTAPKLSVSKRFQEMLDAPSDVNDSCVVVAAEEEANELADAERCEKALQREDIVMDQVYTISKYNDEQLLKEEGDKKL